MPIELHDLAYVRFAAPDLNRMRSFLDDFGMAVAASTSSHLWMRGSGSNPFIHVTELGDPAYLGIGVETGRDALYELAASEGVPVQSLADEPGGGEFIRLQDPDGFMIDVVAGRCVAEPLASVESQAWNNSSALARGHVARRVSGKASTVVRLGHVVQSVADINRCWDWYAERFALTISDDVVAGEGKRVALFIRLARGNESTDHHTFNFGELPSKTVGFHHAAFEVLDFDNLMVGNEYLTARNHQHRCGIGRHILGSQVFDYWADPWGRVHEHWTDGDRFNVKEPSHVVEIDTMLGRQWGPAAPADML